MINDEKDQSSKEESSSSCDLPSPFFEGVIDEENVQQKVRRRKTDRQVAQVTISSSKYESSNEASSDNIDFLKDKPEEMTRSRRLALRLMKQKWYNPHVDNPDVSTRSKDGSISSLAPSLERAWAFFEHVTLMRHIASPTDAKATEMSTWRRFRSAHTAGMLQTAKPGEKMFETRLYDWLSTPHMQLGDWGVGFGLYFSTLRAITFVLACSGIISISNIIFFASTEYDDSDYKFEFMGNLLRYVSAVVDTLWLRNQMIAISCFPFQRVSSVH